MGTGWDLETLIGELKTKKTARREKTTKRQDDKKTDKQADKISPVFQSSGATRNKNKGRFLRGNDRGQASERRAMNVAGGAGVAGGPGDVGGAGARFQR